MLKSEFYGKVFLTKILSKPNPKNPAEVILNPPAWQVPWHKTLLTKHDTNLYTALVMTSDESNMFLGGKQYVAVAKGYCTQNVVKNGEKWNITEKEKLKWLEKEKLKITEEEKVKLLDEREFRVIKTISKEDVDSIQQYIILKAYLDGYISVYDETRPYDLVNKLSKKIYFINQDILNEKNSLQSVVREKISLSPRFSSFSLNEDQIIKQDFKNTVFFESLGLPSPKNYELYWNRLGIIPDQFVSSNLMKAKGEDYLKNLNASKLEGFKDWTNFS